MILTFNPSMLIYLFLKSFFMDLLKVGVNSLGIEVRTVIILPKFHQNSQIPQSNSKFSIHISQLVSVLCCSDIVIVCWVGCSINDRTT